MKKTSDEMIINRSSAVSCCPECWGEDRATMIETSQRDGFVSCPHHGEMTISHFLQEWHSWNARKNNKPSS